MSVPMGWLFALLLTIGVETSIALVLGGRLKGRLIVDVPLINLITHPLATTAYQRASIPFVAIEVVVVGLEALGLWMVTGLDGRRALLLSVVCNSVTAALSFVT